MLSGRSEECAILDGLVADARAGHSGVLVVRGEAGIGKSALLDHLESAASGCAVARATGVEAEMELAYAGLHQLCAPFLDRLDQLPDPQRAALSTAFGLTVGEAPDRFLVGLAVLNLLAGRAERSPLVCLVDDGQWLDRVSAQTLAFVARRLLAERIVFVVAVRTGNDEADPFANLAPLVLGGLSSADAGALLDSVVNGPVDRRVRQRIIAETRGNPLALLELPRAWTTAELVDGFARPGTRPLTSQIEEAFSRRVAALPPDSRLLLLLAAADSLGDAAVLWRGATALGITTDAAGPPEAAGLGEFGDRVRFRHPLVRAAAYRSGSASERRDVHAALAAVTDAELEPDRRAWHQAQAAAAPDEHIAAALERSAGRAKARGGLVAAAALLERAAALTPDPERRAGRQLAAAWAEREAGALDTAAVLLSEVEAGPANVLRAVEVTHLRGQIAFDRRRGNDAARLLLEAAGRLEPLDAELARETYLDALAAAIWASGTDAPDLTTVVAAAARSAPPSPNGPRATDLLLDSLATRFTDGHDAAAESLARALATVQTIDGDADEVGRLLWLGGNRVTAIVATELWDFPAGRALAERQVRRARDAGALVQLQYALNVLAANRLLAGELTEAEALVGEDRLIAEVTGNPSVGYAGMLLAALRGADRAGDRIASSRSEAEALGQGRIVTFADYATAVLTNGLGQHDVALTFARRVFERDVVGGYQTMAVAELGESASRVGDTATVEEALARMAERARVTPTEWARGIENRLRALLAHDEGAEAHHRLSIDHLRRAGLHLEEARARLLLGEWLRRAGRRSDARVELRTAHELLLGMGASGFAERARRELMATGEKTRRRTEVAAEHLTPQESQIALLAREGLSNPEIGTRLFLSPRTVEWHLRKVFVKVGVSSRRELRDSRLQLASG